MSVPALTIYSLLLLVDGIVKGMRDAHQKVGIACFMERRVTKEGGKETEADRTGGLKRSIFLTDP